MLNGFRWLFGSTARNSSSSSMAIVDHRRGHPCRCEYGGDVAGAGEDGWAYLVFLETAPSGFARSVLDGDAFAGRRAAERCSSSDSDPYSRLDRHISIHKIGSEVVARKEADEPVAQPGVYSTAAQAETAAQGNAKSFVVPISCASAYAALIWACRYGHVDFARLQLTRRDVPVDAICRCSAPGERNFTAMDIAAEHGHADLVKLLILYDAVVEDETVMIAFDMGHTEIADILLAEARTYSLGGSWGSWVCYTSCSKFRSAD